MIPETTSWIRSADVSFADYHGDICKVLDTPFRPTISSSGVRTIVTKSPAHYWMNSYLNPDAIPQKPTDAKLLGRAAHWLVLGEEGFRAQFAYRPDEVGGKPWHGNRTVCKQWVQEQHAAGREILTSDMVIAAHGIRDAILEDYLYNEGMLEGTVEESYLWWDDRWPSILMKARPDIVNHKDGAVRIVDMKLTRDSSILGCRRAVREYRYDIQLVMSGRAVLASTGQMVEPENLMLMFVENTPPYCVTWVILSPRELQQAARDLDGGLRRFEECCHTGLWPGYTDGMPVLLGPSQVVTAPPPANDE